MLMLLPLLAAKTAHQGGGLYGLSGSDYCQ